MRGSSVCFCAKTINIVGLATGVGLYVGHLDLSISLRWIRFYGGKMKRLIYETPLDTEEELVALVAAFAMVIFQTPGIF